MAGGEPAEGNQPPVDLLALPSGAVLASGRYELLKLLGSGGFGKTYAATDRVLDRRVAIKEYFPSSLATRTSDRHVTSITSGSGEALFQYGRDKFIEEARTLARFRHPGIVRVNDFFEDNNTAYTVLEFEDGPNLLQWRNGLNRAPTTQEVEHIATRVLDALDAIHEHRIWHRDIAPDNIVLRRNNDPVLIDFGSARHNDKTRSLYRTVKQGYSAKEQYGSGSEFHGPWTDIYAFAATLYFLIFGAPPTDSSDRDLGRECPPAASMSGYPASFLAAVDWGMSLRPDDRPQTIQAWRERLLAAPRRGQAAQTIQPETAQKVDVVTDEPSKPSAIGLAAPVATAPHAAPTQPQLVSPSGNVGTGTRDQADNADALATLGRRPNTTTRKSLSLRPVLFGVPVLIALVAAAVMIIEHNEAQEARQREEAARRSAEDRARAARDFQAEQQRQPGGRIRPRSAFNTDDEYGENLQSELRQGSRVRMRTDEYTSIPRGSQGTFHGREPGGNSAYVVWDTARPDGCFFANLHGSPPSDNNRSSCVDFKDLEVIRQAPPRTSSGR